MSVKERPRWLLPVLLAGGFMVVFFLSNRAQETRTPEGLGVVADEQGYVNTINDAYAVATEPLKHYEDGAQLTPDELAKLHQASNWMDEANLYKPKDVKPFLFSGMLHLSLGDYQKATEKLQQGIANIGDNHSNDMFAAAVLAHYELSECDLAMGDYKQAYLQAAAASESIPNSPVYLIARAKAAMQLESDPKAPAEIAKILKISPKQLDFAREVNLEVAMALKIDPTYKPAIVLGKYLASSKPKK